MTWDEPYVVWGICEEVIDEKDKWNHVGGDPKDLPKHCWVCGCVARDWSDWPCLAQHCGSVFYQSLLSLLWAQSPVSSFHSKLTTVCRSYRVSLCALPEAFWGSRGSCVKSAKVLQVVLLESALTVAEDRKTALDAELEDVSSPDPVHVAPWDLQLKATPAVTVTNPTQTELPTCIVDAEGTRFQQYLKNKIHYCWFCWISFDVCLDGCVWCADEQHRHTPRNCIGTIVVYTVCFYMS